MEEAPVVYVSPTLNSSKKLHIKLVLFFLPLVITLLIGSYFLYQNYRFSQEKKAILNQINKIEEAVQNPNQKLLAKYQISDERILEEQNIIIYGGDPKSIIKGRDNPQDSLRGIKKSLEKNNFSSESKKAALINLKKLFTRAATSMTGKNGKDDMIMLNKEDINTLDPKRLVISKDFAFHPMSEVKKETSLEIIKFIYLLKK